MQSIVYHYIVGTPQIQTQFSIFFHILTFKIHIY